MNTMIIDELSNKKILLLQGPIGYFFRNLARDLKDVNASVYKVNFKRWEMNFSLKMDGILMGKCMNFHHIFSS